MNQPKIKATVVDGGKMAKPVNPNCATDPIMGTSASYLERIKRQYDDFEANNPKLPLIPPRPDLEGQTVDVVEVWQRYSNVTGWFTPKGEHDYIAFQRKTRKIYQLVGAEKEEKPKVATMADGQIIVCGETCVCTDKSMCWFVSHSEPTTPIVQGSEESVKEAAESYITDQHYLSQHMPEMIKHYVKERSHYFIAGANWQKQQSNDEVVAIIETEIKELKEVYFYSDGDVEVKILTDLLATINKNK